MNEQMNRVVSSFKYDGEPYSVLPYGNGHINSTFKVECKNGNNVTRYILQKINSNIFPDTDALIENIENVTEFLKEKIENPKDFYNCGYAFGNFQNLLADFPAEKLHEVIPNFHNTPMRYETFKKAVSADICGRAKSVRKEIDFVNAHASDMFLLTDMLKKGEIPLRVTHNDTKLNNCMFEKKTGETICVIDLDTVMPGLRAYDYGDSIRFGATTGAEDELDLSKVNFSLELFESYTKGFIKACGESMDEKEALSLPIGAKLMTLECGMRFLTDYLEGDTYFKISRKEHNLDRCRTQFKLVSDMEAQWDKINEFVMCEFKSVKN